MNPPALAAGSPLPPHAARPSLFAAGLADPADAQRILTCLLPRPPAKRVPIRLWWVGAGVMVFALSGALYGLMQLQRSMPATQPGAAAAMTAQTLPVAPAAPPVEARPVPPMPAAARIESDAWPAVAPASHPSHELGQVAAPTTMPTAERRSAVVKSRDRAPASVASPTAKRKEDSDVDLLEAIMARVSGSPATPAGKREPRH